MLDGFSLLNQPFWGFSYGFPMVYQRALRFFSAGTLVQVDLSVAENLVIMAMAGNGPKVMGVMVDISK